MDLAPAWRDSPVWRVLDTDFGDGGLFLGTWQAWAADPHHPRLLHYVAITPFAPDRGALRRGMSAFALPAIQGADLERQWSGLVPGFHRMVLQQGQVLLTLCIGPLQAMLREQQFVADAVYLGRPPEVSQPAGWDRWCLKALTRLCHGGTTIDVRAATPQLHGDLAQAGFVFDNHAPQVAPARASEPAMAGLRGRYQPRWEPGATRHPWRLAPPAASSCVVVGAGLAGAMVAAALARRGWRVTVLDAAAQPAAGASGLPVGLLAPQVSRDDSTRSRLSRAGVRATLELCQSVLREGKDWACSGVLELRLQGSPGLPDGWPAAGRSWSDSRPVDAERAAWANGLVHGAASIWHNRAGWIKPARLVQACLARTGVQFVGRSAVHSVTRAAGQWVLLDAAGAVLAQAPQLVIAGACDSVHLSDGAAAAIARSAVRTNRLAAMRAIGGQVSWALQQPDDTPALPPFPVNGLGSFVAHVPMDGALAWLAGATYEHEVPHDPHPELGHHENLERLARLLPAVANTLAQRFASAHIQAWSGTRCTTLDRLPAVGSLDGGPRPGLWVSTGMGSRGLTFAALCAELLAAQLGGEPLPVEASLAKSIAATRRQLLHHL